MTQHDTTNDVPTTGSTDGDAGSSTAEAPPPSPAGRSKGARFAWLLLSLASFAFALVQFAGGLGQLDDIGDLFGPGKVSGEQIASQVSGTGGSGYWICGDLRAEVGATTTCATPADPGASVRATVTAVNGDAVSYDLETM